ncbi:creatininase family protein [Neorhizobium alkalisoli]|uniref:creatininase family protein n=1 Tax=Neorhizobium alkalisoli TaxID=528178 RepID=UPI001319FDDC|nr:creatininase family protein [Neorhizobium alkalisoli]
MIFKEHVRWEFLKPQEFLARQRQRPIVYLPMGLCEPHGHIAPFGLDTIKADWLCDQAADRFGGVVAPTMAYHTHETGYHAPWLEEVMGGVNPRLAALPPHLLLETLLYQFRAFRNAGFQAVVVVSGHHGSQDDLRMTAEAFAEAFPIQHFVRTDPELVTGKFVGDHAGRYELSQLLAIRPDLVALDRAECVDTHPLGRFAQNPDVEEATAEEGRCILDTSLDTLRAATDAFRFTEETPDFIPMEATAGVWEGIDRRRAQWKTNNP